MYTLCLPLTGSDDCVRVVGQYVKSFASTQKLGAGGRRERREEEVRVRICAVIV